jgi:branched-chain amino acid transport system substrate-binding protein
MSGKKMARFLLVLVVAVTLVATACAEEEEEEGIVANFSASPTSGTVPLDVSFTDQSTGDITAWEWDFETDGTVDSTVQNPSHTYDAVGTYTVSLTVTGPEDGDTDTKTRGSYIKVQAPSPLKIGHANSFTGDLSDFGAAHKDAALLAVDHINLAGGILGTVVSVVSRDTATTPLVGVDAANVLVNTHNVVAIVGALSSGVTIAIANSVCIPNSILQISAASTSPALTVLEDNDFLFRTTVSDAVQGVILARLALELGYDTASALYVNNAYGQGLAEAFEDAYEDAGGTVRALVPHEVLLPTYASELSAATAGNPDVLLCLSYPESAGVYIREALEGDYIDTFLFCDGTKSPAMNEAIGWELLEGTYGTAAGTEATDVTLAFAEAWELAFAVPVPPLPYIDTTYDAVVLIALAAAKAGTTTDSAAIRDALRDVANPPGEVVGPGVDGIARALELIAAGEDINYEGAGGSQDFDQNGDVISTIEIWKIEGGEIVSTGRYELP